MALPNLPILRAADMMRNQYVRIARKTWPRAVWIIGEGPYASVSRWPPGDTVMLFGSMAEAEIVTRFIDSTGCGQSCRRDHLAVELKIKRRRAPT
jgi:hypothetical protein